LTSLFLDTEKVEILILKGYNEKAISERSFPKVQENYNKLYVDTY